MKIQKSNKINFSSLFIGWKPLFGLINESFWRGVFGPFFAFIFPIIFIAILGSVLGYSQLLGGALAIAPMSITTTWRMSRGITGCSSSPGWITTATIISPTGCRICTRTWRWFTPWATPRSGRSTGSSRTWYSATRCCWPYSMKPA